MDIGMFLLGFVGTVIIGYILVSSFGDAIDEYAEYMRRKK